MRPTIDESKLLPWKTSPDAARREDAASKREDAASEREDAASEGGDETSDEGFIYLKDAVGRRFTFPFDMAKKWQDMETLISMAFQKVDAVGPHVKNGHYDLHHSGMIILPAVWERLVKPGWDVSMTMWPTDKDKPIINDSITKEPSSKPVEVPRKEPKPKWRGQGYPLRPSPPPPPPPPPLGARPKAGLDGQQQPTVRAWAIKNGLTEVPQPATQKRPIYRHLTFPLGGDNSPPPVVKRNILSAYAFESETNDRVTLELTEQMAPNLVVKESPSAGEKDGFRWVSAVRDYMDLEEFEHIALDPNNLQVDANQTVAIENAFKSVTDREMPTIGSNKYVKARAVTTRCDVTSGDKVVASAILMTRKGAKVPQRLHESLIMYDSSLEQDKRQVFPKYDGKKADEVLWVREAWILVVDSGIITYGGQPTEAYLGKNIEIRAQQPVWEKTGRAVHVKYRNKWFSLPLDQCETYFDLQSSIRAEVAILDDFEEEHLPDLIVEIITGELTTSGPITAGDWSRSAEAMKEKVIRVFVYQRRPEKKADPFWPGKNQRKELPPLTKNDWERPALNHPGRGKDRRRSHNLALGERADFFVPPEASATDPDPDEQGPAPLFQALRSQPPVPETPEVFRLPDLDPSACPFLAWAKTKDETTTGTAAASSSRARRTHQDIQASVAACLANVEAALERKDNPYVRNLLNTFQDPDSDLGNMDVSAAQVRQKLIELGLEADRGGGTGEARESLTLYDNFANASIRVLQAFVPETSGFPVLEKCYSALYKGLEMRNDGEPLENLPSRWVTPIKPGSHHSSHSICPDCENNEIYDSEETALKHLQKGWRINEIPGPELLRKHVTPLSAAAASKLNKERCSILRKCRDILVEVIEHAVEIQSGTVSSGGGGFQNPAYGVPYAMLEATQVLVAFVRSVPLLLGEVDRFFKVDVYDKSVSRLELSSSFRMRRTLLEEAGRSLRVTMRKAERALISSLTSVRRNDAIKFFQPVGPQCLALQMVDNLVRSSIRDGKVASQLYGEYGYDYSVQAKCRPSKRLLPNFGFLKMDLAAVYFFISEQKRLVHQLDTFLSPSSYRDQTAAVVRGRTFPTENCLTRNTWEWLAAQNGEINWNLNRCSDTEDEMRNTLEVLQDDNSRVLFVFTAVTVVFLPLSFVATYLSMNGGPSQGGWANTQKVFWEVSAPLAVGVVIFCLIMARGYDSEEAGLLGDWLKGLVRGRTGRKGARGAITEPWETSESETTEDEDDTYRSRS